VRSPVRRGLATILLLAAALPLGACAGGEDENPQERLSKAFSKQVKSADVRADAEISTTGGQGLPRPVRIRARGPFKSNKDKLPSANIEVSLDAGGGGGQTVSTGFLSTGDRAFVRFQGVFYEQPVGDVRRTNEQIARNQNEGQSLKALGLDPQRWLSDAKEEGEEEIGGDETRHISGNLNVRAFLDDLNRFVRERGGTLGRAAGQPAPEPLPQRDLARIAEVVKDPSFDIYVNKDDDTVRRIASRVKLQVPEGSRRQLRGIESGTLTFSIELSNVNGDQKIEAPAKARPISDLTDALGQGALGGGLGGSGASPGGSPGGTRSPSPTPSPSTPPGTQSPGAEDYKRYADCLERNAGDTDALQRCSQLVQ